MKRKICMGMVGGGRGAFIGAVHRMAAQLDGMIELVCGAFSSDPVKSKESGKDLFLPPDRVYSSYAEMFQKEKNLSKGVQMDFVCIVTPNHCHYPVAKMALENGFSVMSDKPMTYNLKEALKLQKLVKKTGLLFGLTHNYTGYPLVKHAREIIKAGKFGKIRKIIVEYPQGWLTKRLEATGQKQAAWRTDPKRAGASCCVGDIGTHAENLSEYITGLEIEELCADLTTFVKGRPLEDDGNILVHFKGGARGILYASQISVGEENALAIRVYGEKGGLAWRQEEPNTLLLMWPDRFREVVRAGCNYGDRLEKTALENARLPAGHPEGFIEAFANLYRNYAQACSALIEERHPVPECFDFPNIEDGVRGMRFIEAVVKSAKKGSTWIRM